MSMVRGNNQTLTSYIKVTILTRMKISSNHRSAELIFLGILLDK